MEKNIITQYFEELDTTKEYNGYFCSVAEAVTIVILGGICGLKNISQIHQWASSEKVSGFLRTNFAIENIPCYYWLLCLLKLIIPESLNRCSIKWAETMLPEKRDGLTISVDGKTIRSTGQMERYEEPLHIVSAQVSEPGITFARKSVDGKSSEIPAVQELLEQPEISGCIVVAGALNCRKKTAAAVIGRGADYLLCAMDNQETLKKDIEEYVQDEKLRAAMDTKSMAEKNRGRIENRTAFVTGDINRMPDRDEWKNLKCIGAVKSASKRPVSKIMFDCLLNSSFICTVLFEN